MVVNAAGVIENVSELNTHEPPYTLYEDTRGIKCRFGATS
jgi:hypothetical protein